MWIHGFINSKEEEGSVSTSSLWQEGRLRLLLCQGGEDNQTLLHLPSLSHTNTHTLGGALLPLSSEQECSQTLVQWLVVLCVN